MSSDLLLASGEGTPNGFVAEKNELLKSIQSAKQHPVAQSAIGYQYKPLRGNNNIKGHTPTNQQNTVDDQQALLEKNANKGKKMLSEKDVDNILQVGKQQLHAK